MDRVVADSAYTAASKSVEEDNDGVEGGDADFRTGGDEAAGVVATIQESGDRMSLLRHSSPRSLRLS